MLELNKFKVFIDENQKAKCIDMLRHREAYKNNMRLLSRTKPLSYEYFEITNNKDIFKIQNISVILHNNLDCAPLKGFGIVYDKKINVIEYLENDLRYSRHKSLSSNLNLIFKNKMLINTPYEWLTSLGYIRNVTNYFITTDTMSGILNNSIRNYKDLFRTLIKKYNLGKFSHKAFNDLVVTKNNNFLRTLTFLKASNNPSRDYPIIIDLIKNDKVYTNLRDLVNFVETTGEKINFTWSENRVREEHDRQSDIVTEFKLLATKLDVIEYKNEIPYHPYITLLKTTHDYFSEGSKMGHCVFSGSYFQNAKDKQIIILSYNKHGERGTLEYDLKNNSIVQFRGRFNAVVENDITIDMNKYLNSKEFLKWVNIELGKIPIEHANMDDVKYENDDEVLNEFLMKLNS